MIEALLIDEDVEILQNALLDVSVVPNPSEPKDFKIVFVCLF